MSKPFNFKLALLAVPLAVAGLTACGPKSDDRTAGQKLDSAIQSTEQKADEAKQSISETAQDAKAGAADATDKMANAVSDAAITTAVNAELAKDSKLSAIKIDVDTRNGYVTLKGSAPDTLSQDRATTLAASVKGVVKVDNQLRIGG